MRERFMAVAVAAASFAVVTGAIVGVGLANAQPASAQLGADAGRALSLAWSEDAARATTRVYAEAGRSAPSFR